MNKWKGKKIRRKVRKVGKGKVLRRFRFKAVRKLQKRKGKGKGGKLRFPKEMFFLFKIRLSQGKVLHNPERRKSKFK